MLFAMGMVCTVSATILHIGMEVNYTGDVYVYRYDGSSPDDWYHMGDPQKAILDGNLYGRRWYHIDMNGNTSAIVRYDSWSKRGAAVTGISGDNCYIYLSNNQVEKVDDTETHETGFLSSKGWQKMKFSNDVEEKWDDDANECIKVDDNTFTYTLTKSKIDAASKSIIYFRFKLVNGVFFVGDYYWDQHYFRLVAPTKNEVISIAENTSNVLHKTDWINNWELTVPTGYNYEKLVFTIKDLSSGTSFDESGTWQVRVDAYIKKQIGETGYATFGSAADVDFTNYEGPAGLEFKKGKVQSDGTITWTTATTLNSAEGVLLHGTSGDYYIPVTASNPSTDPTNNDFVAIPSATTIDQTMGGQKAYLLAKPAGKPLGFYKPYSGGTSCSAGTAYLKTTYGPAAAREYFPLWDESANIDEVLKTNNVNSTYYNLAGQQVSQPTKGLYIVNGKKVVIR